MIYVSLVNSAFVVNRLIEDLSMLLLRHWLVLPILIALLSACGGRVQEVNGPRLESYQYLGESRTVVFIHGMHLTPKVWEPWESYFSDVGYETHGPAWPLHDLSVDELKAKHPDPELGALTLTDVVDHYRDYIAQLEEKPILIGHSMGGLVTQILLQEGIASAGIIIHSAPPNGVISADPSFLQSNWATINPLIPASRPLNLSFRQFQFAFVNDMPLAEQEFAYEEYVVPESRRVGRSTLTSAAEIDVDLMTVPVLFLSGGNDNIIPASLNYSNFRKYRDREGVNDYKQFSERNHWTLSADDWELVADHVLEWIDGVRYYSAEPS